MSSQQRVQAYLEKHRISALFEDLMARLIKHLPNEPIPYLLKVLQRFDEKTPKPPDLSASMPAMKKSSSLDLGGKSKTTSGWTAASLTGMGEDRGYERPWVHHMKKLKGRPDETEPQVRRSKKMDSTGKKRTPTSEADLEQIFKKEQHKGKTVSFQSGAKQWAASGDEDSPLAPRRNGTIAAEEKEAELLQEEMSAAKLQKKYSKTEPTRKTAPSSNELKELRQKPGEKAKKHKKELAEMAAAQRKVETLGYLDSGEEPTDPDQAGYEEATDLLEDMDDLAFEGVTNAKSSGKRVSKSMRRRAPPPEPEVKVAICSKCARLVGSDDVSTAGGNAYGKYGAFDSLSDVTAGEYGGTFSAPVTSDDDFESASQVVGPRHPVWVESKNGASPTRPGSTGLRSSMVHDSSRELFSGSSQEAGDSAGTHRVDSSLVGQAWGAKTYRSQTEASPRQVVHSDSLLDKGRSWQQPSSDEDSGF
ncbi:uncharacterized protein C8orf34 homolog isoform X2 [Patiria miniata]|uniref:Uncharacterized protein n=1 Tax=Patiria miniata TaxID=46514 RepID=A0A913ZLN5_PATMI|nr:uncharacterized protein C8orf34 homolog isoform X2 [Patiria miniata]